MLKPDILGTETVSPDFDTLIGALVGIARTVENDEDAVASVTDFLIDALSAAGQSTSEKYLPLIEHAHREKWRLSPDCASCAFPCGRTADYDASLLRQEPFEIRRLKAQLLLCLFGAAEIFREAKDSFPAVNDFAARKSAFSNFLVRALFAIGDVRDSDDLRTLIQEAHSYCS